MRLSGICGFIIVLAVSCVLSAHVCAAAIPGVSNLLKMESMKPQKVDFNKCFAHEYDCRSCKVCPSIRLFVEACRRVKSIHPGLECSGAEMQYAAMSAAGLANDCTAFTFIMPSLDDTNDVVINCAAWAEGLGNEETPEDIDRFSQCGGAAGFELGSCIKTTSHEIEPVTCHQRTSFEYAGRFLGMWLHFGGMHKTQASAFMDEVSARSVTSGSNLCLTDSSAVALGELARSMIDAAGIPSAPMGAGETCTHSVCKTLYKTGKDSNNAEISGAMSPVFELIAHACCSY